MFRVVLLSQINENVCVFLLRNRDYLEDNKKAFDNTYEEFQGFLESLKQNPERIANIHHLLKAINESTSKQEGYDLVVEILLKGPDDEENNSGVNI